jgi:hypothetical protein
MLKNEHDRPILLTIGHKLSHQGPYKIEYSYNKYFMYDSDSLRKFRRHTAKVAGFRQARREKYDVFLLKGFSLRIWEVLVSLCVNCFHILCNCLHNSYLLAFRYGDGFKLCYIFTFHKGYV